MTVPALPRAPRSLGKDGRRLWKSVTTDYEVGPGELELLETACLAYQRHLEAQVLLDRDGLVVEGRYGVRAHPAAALARDNAALMARALRQLRVELEDDVVKVRSGARGGNARGRGGRPSTVRRTRGAS
jgi:hypothetical protein